MWESCCSWAARDTTIMQGMPLYVDLVNEVNNGNIAIGSVQYAWSEV